MTNYQLSQLKLEEHEVACECTACERPLAVDRDTPLGSFMLCTWCGWSLTVGPGPSLHNLTPEEIACIKADPGFPELLRQREEICRKMVY